MEAVKEIEDGSGKQACVRSPRSRMGANITTYKQNESEDVVTRAILNDLV